MKIKSINLSAMTQDESFQFHSTISGFFKEANYLETSAPEGNYVSAILAFDVALKQVRQSDKTAKIAELHEKRIHLYLGIVQIVGANILHFDPEYVSAANKLEILLNNYDNPSKVAYNAATSVIYNLSQDLVLPEYVPLMAKLGLTEWAVELKKANDEFDVLFVERNSEQSVLIAGLAKDSRDLVEKLYRVLIVVAESEILIKPNCPLEKYVKEINELIAYYKKTIAARRTRNVKRKDKNDTTTTDKPNDNGGNEGPIEIKDQQKPKE
jgi:hypothetical protein